MLKSRGLSKLLFLMIFITAIGLASCRVQTPTQPEQLSTLKIAVLPILDTLPMYVAEENGLFTREGVQVEFTQASSAPKRDELINSGQVDAMINEIVSTIFYNRDETRVQIVRYARVATQDSAIFRILASGQSGITTVEGLKGVEIGVSQGTVIEYLTNRLLQAEGFNPNEIEVIAVPDIGQRMALLASGELKAAMLPDPLASLAIQQGAVLIIEDSSHPEFSNSVYTFRKSFIDQNPEAVRGFLAAIEEAVHLINANPDNYSELLIDKKLVPPPLEGAFSVPTFVTAEVPTKTQWDDVIDWINEKDLNSGSASYSESVTANYLP